MKLAMIYMASGFARRFGANKLLAPLDGVPLFLYGLKCLIEAAKLLEEGELRPAASQLRYSEPIRPTIITVSQYPEILQAAASMGAQAVYNPDSHQGITASLRLGTASAGQDVDYYLYFVADEPYIKAETIAAFVRGFLGSGKSMGTVEGGGRPASPSMFHKAYRPALLSLEGDKGGRRLMKSRPEDVWAFEVPAAELKDIDVPEDME